MRSPLKSSIGPNEWLIFFQTLSKVFAHRELKPKTFESLPEFHSDLQTLNELIYQHNIKEKLNRFNHLIRHIESKGSSRSTVYVLHLKPSESKTFIYQFKANDIERAMSWYSQLEADADLTSGDDVVLVRSDSIKELKKAYPNYFLDTRKVITELNKLEKYISKQSTSENKWQQTNL